MAYHALHRGLSAGIVEGNGNYALSGVCGLRLDVKVWYDDESPEHVRGAYAGRRGRVSSRYPGWEDLTLVRT